MSTKSYSCSQFTQKPPRVGGEKAVTLWPHAMLTKSTQREIGDGDYGERAVCANSLLPSVCGVDGKNVLLTLVFSELPLLISPTPPSRRTLLTYSTETYSIWRGRKNTPHIGKRGTPCLEV